MDEVQGSMVTAEWPPGVLTYTSESTVSCGIQTVMRTSPLHVLLQVADTSGPWIAGGVLRLLLFLYIFPWAMLQNGHIGHIAQLLIELPGRVAHRLVQTGLCRALDISV